MSCAELCDGGPLDGVCRVRQETSSLRAVIDKLLDRGVTLGKQKLLQQLNKAKVLLGANLAVDVLSPRRRQRLVVGSL